MISNELLKKKILDEAIHGRLVENDLSLLAIEVKAVTDNIPFDIPNNWKWSKLGNLGVITSSKRVFKNEWKNEGVPFYRARDIVSLNKGLSASELYISEKMYKEYSKKYGIPKKGDILLTGVGTIGESYIVKENDKFYFKDGNIIWLKKSCDVDSMYLKKYFESNLFKNQVYQTAKGATVLTLTIVHAKEILIPIPPLEEQEKIVKTIEELFELVDKKEKNDKEKEKLKTLLKEKILDSAIHGKIIENDLSLPAVDVEETKDAVPFDIPNNWKWVNIYNIFTTSSGSFLSEEEKIKEGEYPVYGGNGIISNYINYNVEKDTLVIGRVGYYCGNVKLTLTKSWVNDNALIVKMKIKDYYSKYMLYILNNSDLKNRNSSTAQPVVSYSKIKNILIPIPPLEQQKKIVDKIEECFKLIEQL